MLSTSCAVAPEPATQVVMWPLVPLVSNATISPAVTIDCQSPVCPAGPLKATIHSPAAWPGTPRKVLVAGRPAPASVAMVLASVQQPLVFQAAPTKLCATAAIEEGVACAVALGEETSGAATRVALPR